MYPLVRFDLHVFEDRSYNDMYNNLPFSIWKFMKFYVTF